MGEFGHYGGMMKTMIALAVSAAFLSAAPSGAAVVVFADDFSGYGTTTVLNAPDSTFGGSSNAWKTTAGTVDYLASGSGFGTLCVAGTNCVDLDGSTNDAGVFETTQVFRNGIFNVLFQFSGSNREASPIDSLTVAFGGIVQTINIAFNQVGNQDSFGTAFFNVAVGALGTTLSFLDGGSDNMGVILKNVVVEQVAPVPVPAAGGLMLLALGGLAALRRRRVAAI